MPRFHLPLLLLMAFSFSFFTFRKTTRVVFFGDSITEAGVLPGGYIARLRDSLQTSAQARHYELIGAGIGGNKIYDLYLRLEKDVLARRPKVVVVYVGVNDVWHKQLFGTGTDAPKFRQFYAAMIEKMQARGIRLILCTPACIGEKTDHANGLDAELDLFSQIIRDLAGEYNCTLCDLRAAFGAYQAAHNPTNASQGILTSDGVHLNSDGNALVAKMLMDKI